MYGYRMSYSRMLEKARMLAAFVRGEIPSYTGFTCCDVRVYSFVYFKDRQSV